MSLATVRQTPIAQFLACLDQSAIPPLKDYLPQFVRDGCEAEAEAYRFVPLAASTLRFIETGSPCLTDCTLELHSKYELFIPDDWGGRMDRGWRDVAAIGFNVESVDDVAFELVIREINQTTCHKEWAEPRLDVLDWQGLLIQAVVDFGRFCGAVRIAADELYADVVQRCGFTHEPTMSRFVLCWPSA